MRNEKGQFVKGEPSPRKGIKKPGWTNQTSFKKLGEKYTYGGLHTWIRAHSGSATIKECTFCNGTKKLEWANISHEYKEELSDYMVLCNKCHHKYDNQSNKAWKTRKERYGSSGRKITYAI